MEELMQELAKITGLGVDGLLASYPVLREQFTRTYLISGVLSLLEIALYFVFMLWILSSVLTLMELSSDWKRISSPREYLSRTSVRVWIILIALGALLALTMVGLNAKMTRLAPDLMFLMSLIKK